MNALSILYVIERGVVGDYVLGSESLQETSNTTLRSEQGEGLHRALSDRFSLDTQVEKHNSATSNEPDSLSVPKLLSDIGIKNSSLVLGDPYPHFRKGVEFLRCILEVCFDTYEKFSLIPWKSLLSPLASMEDWHLEDFEKNCKYSLSYPMAHICSMSSDDLPELPRDFKVGLGPALLFRGKALQFLKSRINGRGGKLVFKWANSMLQGAKRGCPTVSSYFQVGTMLKHRAVLSKKAPLIDDVRNFGIFCRERVDLSGCSSQFKLREISTSACFDRSVKDGGAREQVRSKLKDTKGLLKMDYNPSTGVIQVDSEIMPYTPAKIIRKLINKSVVNHDFPEEISMCKAKVAPVLEPLKCRLITAGSSDHYYLSRGYQKDLWTRITRFPQFVATSRPINSFDLKNLLDRERLLTLPEPLVFWVSGDYSAATDNVNMHYTKVMFEHCLENSEFENLSAAESSLYKEILRSVLYEHEIHYPLDPARIEKLCEDFITEMREYGFSTSDKINGCLKLFDQASELTPFIQYNGQLMGSTLSFPILCLINLIQYWRSLEEYTGDHYNLVDLPVLVNGDDILFRSNPVHYKIWKDYTARAGFSLSIGKNYTHKHFLCINSQAYWESNGNIEEIPYFNVGLLMGKSKGNNKKGGISEFSGLSLDAMYNEMIGGSSNPNRATRRFLHYNSHHISKITQRGLFNLFIPRVLGGCGFIAKDGIDYHVTDFQHAICLDSFEAIHKIQGSQPNLRSKADPFIVIEREKVPRLRGGRREWCVAPYGPLEEGQEEFKCPSMGLWSSLSVSCPTDFEINRDFTLSSSVKKLSDLYRRYKENGGKPIRKGIRDRYYQCRIVSKSRIDRYKEPKLIENLPSPCEYFVKSENPLYDAVCRGFRELIPKPKEIGSG